MSRKILIQRLDAIGDFVLFTSALPSIRGIYKHDSLTLVVNPVVEGIADGCPYIDHLFAIDPQRYASDSDYVSEVATMVREKYDVIINAKYTRTWQSDNIIARSRAPVKIGFECADRDNVYEQRRASEVLYTTLVPATGEWKFEIDRYVDLLKTLGVTVKPSDLKPDLWLSPGELAWADKFIRENVPPDRRLCIVCHGAGFDSKLWPLDRYAPVLRKLVSDHGFVPMILGGPKDSGAAAEIIRTSDCGALDFTGKLKLREFAALTGKADLYVGIDTAGFHFAWTQGVPAVGIFGGGHDTRFIPDVPHVRTVRVPMDCYRCYWHCIYDEIKCITAITPAMVSDAVEELLSSTPRPGVH